MFDSNPSRRYRQGALSLWVLTAACLIGVVAGVRPRDVLLGIAGLTAVGGILLLTVFPGRYVRADVAEAMAAAASENRQAVAMELGFCSEPRYVQTADGMAVRLVVPGRPERLPDGGSLHAAVVDDGAGALSLEPTGWPLYVELRAAADSFPDEPSAALAACCEGAVSRFDLAAAATVVRFGDGTATVRVSGSALGDLDRAAAPLRSLCAVCLASTLGRPVSVGGTDTDGSGWTEISYEWEPAS